MIRVFPRRTKWTPTDPLAFVGDPPLFRPPEQPVFVSCTFTWDVKEARRLVKAWQAFYGNVKLGGPGLGARGLDFVPGRFVREGMVFTSRGCIRHCPWCLAWRREGGVRELPIASGWNVQDNNLLACSRPHIEAVFAMLRQQQHRINFTGGLDVRLFRSWHRDLLLSINLDRMWFAYDDETVWPFLERVASLVRMFPQRTKRCYVLVGYTFGDTPEWAEKRLKYVLELGMDPFAIYYRPAAEIRPKPPPDWRDMLRVWSRPALYRRFEDQPMERD